MPNRVALLRGINVGGNNAISMRELAAALGRAGLADVSTYINSGNVLFSSEDVPADLEGRVAAVIADAFGLDIPVLVASAEDLAAVVAAAPAGFASDLHRSDVIFLLRGTAPEEALAALPGLAEGVDEVWPGPGVLYFRRLTERATRSKLTKVIGMPVYRRMTIRNWNTTTKLHALTAG